LYCQGEVAFLLFLLHDMNFPFYGASYIHTPHFYAGDFFSSFLKIFRAFFGIHFYLLFIFHRDVHFFCFYVFVACSSYFVLCAWHSSSYFFYVYLIVFSSSF